jgi:tetratricopeptide (TPR) repeat protein
VATLDRRALVYMKLRETDKAIADYDAVLRLDPDDALARYSRGVARERLGDIAGATADRTAAQSLQPGVADAFEKLGLR